MQRAADTLDVAVMQRVADTRVVNAAVMQEQHVAATAAVAPRSAAAADSVEAVAAAVASAEAVVAVVDAEAAEGANQPSSHYRNTT
jgi:hypothetical protein